MPRTSGLWAITLLLLPLAAEARELPRAYRSAKMLGSGGAGMATVTDSDALLYNPANLGFMPDDLTEISVFNFQVANSNDVITLYKNQDEMKELQKKPVKMARYLEGKDLHVGIQNFSGASFSQHSIGFITDAHANFEVVEDPIESLPDISGQADVYAGILYGYGRKMQWQGQNFSVGANLKLMQKQQQVVALKGAELVNQQSRDEELDLNAAVTKFSGSGLGSDIALTWLPNLPYEQRVSLVVRNLGSMGFSGGDSAPSLDRQTFNLGVGSGMLLRDSHHIQLSADVEDLFDAYDNNFYKRLHLGSAYTFAKIAGVSLGFNQGYPTYGFHFGYQYAFFEYTRFKEELGAYPGDKESKRSTFKLKLGWWL